MGNKTCSMSSLSIRNCSALRNSLIPVSSTKILAASNAFFPNIFTFTFQLKLLLYLPSMISWTSLQNFSVSATQSSTTKKVSDFENVTPMLDPAEWSCTKSWIKGHYGYRHVVWKRTSKVCMALPSKRPSMSKMTWVIGFVMETNPAGSAMVWGSRRNSTMQALLPFFQIYICRLKGSHLLILILHHEYVASSLYHLSLSHFFLLLSKRGG